MSQLLTPQGAWTWVGAYSQPYLDSDQNWQYQTIPAQWVRVADLQLGQMNALYVAPYIVAPPAGAPGAPGPVVMLAGAINSGPDGIWGPCWVDQNGVFYGTSTNWDGSWVPLIGTSQSGQQWTAAGIQAGLSGTATASAQAAIHNASHGIISDITGNLLFQIVSAAYGLYSAYTYFGLSMPSFTTSGIDYTAQASAMDAEFAAQAAASDAAVQAAAQAAEYAAQAAAQAAAEQAAQDAAIQAAQQAAATQAAADAAAAQAAAQQAAAVAAQNAADLAAQQAAQAAAQQAADAAARQAAADAAAQATAQANEFAAQAAQQAAATQAAADSAAYSASGALDAANAASGLTQDAIDAARQAADIANQAAANAPQPYIPDPNAAAPAYAGATSGQADWVSSADLPFTATEAAGQTISTATSVTIGTAGAFTDAMGLTYGTAAEAQAANLSYGLTSAGDLLPADAAAAAASLGLPSWTDAATITKIATAAGTLAKVIGGQKTVAPATGINPATGLPYGINPGVASGGINAQTISSLLPIAAIAGLVLLAVPGGKKRKSGKDAKK